MTRARRIIWAAVLVAGLLSVGPIQPANADSPFGTADDAATAATNVIDHAAREGIDSMVADVGDPASIHHGSPMAIIIKELVDDETMMIRVHNKFPEINDMDFSTVQDLDGNRIFADTVAALDDQGDGAITEFVWPRFDDGTEYRFRCLNRWINDARDHVVTVCH